MCYIGIWILTKQKHIIAKIINAYEILQYQMCLLDIQSWLKCLIVLDSLHKIVERSSAVCQAGTIQCLFKKEAVGLCIMLWSLKTHSPSSLEPEVLPQFISMKPRHLATQSVCNFLSILVFCANLKWVSPPLVAVRHLVRSRCEGRSFPQRWACRFLRFVFSSSPQRTASQERPELRPEHPGWLSGPR